ncbi:hypothetical protein BJY04DRAFT_231560 [Aspergillus karnatakaensis]|uniref:uncharacterized protein n=1 Tax=Aspergillus karnatakaensis TaxID=1810916 RepID=UPI003CCE4536
MTDRDTTVLGADRACSSCKKNKRRCDKLLPACASCVRSGRECSYLNDTQSDELGDLQRRVRELEQTVSRLSGRDQPDSLSAAAARSPDLSTQAYFLDSEVWSSKGLSARSNLVSPRAIPPPDDVLSVIGRQNAIANIMNGYYQSIHSWMPFISKIKLERAIQQHYGRLGGDTALLLLTMMLVQLHPAANYPGFTELYNSAKRYSKTLGLEGVLTLRTIQAGILITIFELSHGIYPAAFFSISYCARQSVVLGLHDKNAPQMLRGPRSWVDWEERQRVWWAIVILDRYITVGGSHRPLCTSDPAPDTILPSNDDAWNNGEQVAPDRVSLSSPTNHTLGSFARLAQAANLLGRVINHLNETNLDTKLKLDDFETLTQAIYSLVELLAVTSTGNSEASSPLNNAIAQAICYSALFKLSDHHCSTLWEENGLVHHEAIAPRARESMKTSFYIVRDTCSKATLLARELANILEQQQQGAPGNLDGFSPLVLECLYTCSQNLIWMRLETNNPEFDEWNGVVDGVLRGVKGRWGVAGVYLELLQVSEIGEDE